MSDRQTRCRRGCPDGECYCGEMTYAEEIRTARATVRGLLGLPTEASTA